MLGVVLVTADLPVVCFHGLLATGKVLLNHEVDLVLGDLRQILLALVHHLRYRREAHTCKQLVLGRTRATLGFLAEVQPVTVGVLGGRYAVGAEEHFGTAMLSAFTRFTQCAGNRINTGAPFYFCHFVSALFSLAPYEGLRLDF